MTRGAVCCVLLLLVLYSAAQADTRHFVFGLDPQLSYDVRQGDVLVVSGVRPGPAGDIQFTTTATSPIDIHESRPGPNAVLDLEAGRIGVRSVTLRWTAPADGAGGRLASYEGRYAIGGIDDSTWAAATPIDPMPVPSTPGAIDSIEVLALEPATNYAFAVRGRDGDGVLSPLGSVLELTTATSADSTPPAIPQGIAIEPREDHVALSWSRTRDADVEGYVIYRRTAQDGATFPVLVRTAVTEYADTSALPEIEYKYSIAAYDTSGNVSTRSPETTILLPLEGFLPVIGDFSQSASSSPAEGGPADAQRVQIVWSARPGARFAGFSIDRSTDDGATWDCRTPSLLGAGSDSAFAFEETVDPGVYMYRVCAISPRGYERDFPSIGVECGLTAPTAAIERPFPNPCKGRFQIRLAPERESGARVTLCDPTGRVCGLLRPEGGNGSGAQMWQWGTDGSGARPLASGLYFVRIEGAGGAIVRKIIVRK